MCHHLRLEGYRNFAKSREVVGSKLDGWGVGGGVIYLEGRTLNELFCVSRDWVLAWLLIPILCFSVASSNELSVSSLKG